MSGGPECPDESAHPVGLVMAALKALKEECLKNSLASQFGPPLPGALTDARITEYYSHGSL